MQVRQSRRYRDRLEEASFCESGKCRTRSDAAAWGRIAAVQGWGLSCLSDEVEEQFHAVAKAAYTRRMKQLYGAPF